jgi:cyclase
MLRPRVIPVLLLKGGGLYKTVQFKNPSYVGDPLNTMRIFNEKEVDEICVLDIAAPYPPKGINIERIKELASEAFMPLSYGGGIRSLDDAKALFKAGVEKVVVNRLAAEDPDEARRIAKFAGSSSLVVSIDVRRKFLGKYEMCVQNGSRPTGASAIDAARAAEALGAGEILLTSIDRDGTQQGYDVDLIHSVSHAVQVPVVACGGAGTLKHLGQAMTAGASAAAAGSMFVYQGRHRAVLISYPSPAEIESLSRAPAQQ